jgi:hypothetical protein
VPFSYAQYAGNGSTTTFSVPFPYLLKAHVKLYTGYDIVDGTFDSELTEGTDFTWTSGTQVQTTAAPATGVTLTILRDTPDSLLLVDWQDGSNLIANDLDTSDLQNLYVVQEQQDRNDASVAATAASTAAAAAAAAAAETAAASAATDAATASTDAAAATTAAAAATATADAAAAAAASATTTANDASTNAANAAAIAANAANDATTALSTANTASADATAAVSTADTALASVAASVQYTPVADVASIPASPADGTFIEISNGTGIESFTPLVGLPVGFVGDSGLSVRLRYSTSNSSWNWLNYFANDADSRYLQQAGGTLTGAVGFAGSQPTATTSSPNIVQLESAVTSNSETEAATPKAVKVAYDEAVAASAAAAAASVAASTADGAAAAAQATADAALPKSGGTMTGDIAFAASQAYPKVPQVAKSSAYTLTASDAGKHISITTGGVTVPAGIFSAGDAVSIFNNSASSQTITQGGSTVLRFAGSSSTGNRTLAQYGLCTILCVGSNAFVISGAGLS